MRQRIALALLVATCAAHSVSSTSMDDHVNKKTETEAETVYDSNQEARGVWDKMTSYTSSWLPSVKSVAAKDDALINGVKTAATKTDEAGGGLSNAARQGDDVGEGVKAVGKQGDEVDDGVKAVAKNADDAGNAAKEGTKVKKRVIALATVWVAIIVGSLVSWAYSKGVESEKMTPLEPMSGSNLDIISE